MSWLKQKIKKKQRKLATKMYKHLVMEKNLKKPIGMLTNLMQHRIISQSTYFGVRALKSPTDFWVYQELAWEIKPKVIVEVGNEAGGMLLAWAHLMDLMEIKGGKVIGVDIDHSKIHAKTRRHPRIKLVTGDACQCFPQVKKLVGKSKPVLVIEDSSHTYENTLNVMRDYQTLVTPGSYLIVEDSNSHHGIDDGPSPGPYEAIESFVKENRGFKIDRSRESFLITWNPKGYLKKKE